MYRKHDSELQFCYEIVILNYSCERTTIENNGCIKTVILNYNFYLNYYSK
jgi:hypothetical protein